MRYIFLILAFVFCKQTFSQSGVYALSVPALKGGTININDYAGKKIMVASVSPEILQNGYLAFLDSLQAANSQVIIIAVAALDFGGENNTSIMNAIKADTGTHVLLTSPGLVKKETAADQNDLMHWLTTDTENVHFNSDVVTDCQVYLINSQGALYAVLEKNVPVEVINTLLHQ